MRTSIVALVRQNKINSIVYSLLVPLLIGVFAVYYEPLKNINPLLFWGPTAALTVLAFLSAYLTFDVKLAPEVYAHMFTIEKERDSLKNAVSLLSILQELCLVYFSVIRNHLCLLTYDEKTLRDVIVNICDLVADDRSELFGIESNEIWSLSCYIYSSKEEVLRCVWRAKSKRHPSRGAARDWKPGCGHVGLAFANAQTKICPDATAPGVWETVSGPDPLPYDRKAYVSFASQPIMADEVTLPYGVLVATSNKVGRFDTETGLALRQAAGAIATLVRLKYNDSVRDKLCDEAR